VGQASLCSGVFSSFRGDFLCHVLFQETVFTVVAKLFVSWFSDRSVKAEAEVAVCPQIWKIGLLHTGCSASACKRVFRDSFVS
jgi:hypothetical protein